MIYKESFIHPTSIVEEGVVMGVNNWIGPFCVIKNGTIIGSNNRFESHCSIGAPAESREFFGGGGLGVSIGDNNIFREGVTIHEGTENKTVIGSGNLFLRSSHVGHDSIIGDKVNVSCSVLIGGHTKIMDGANFGLGCIIHQKQIIGAYCMIGMGAVITKKLIVSPFGVFVGNPAKYIKQNSVGLSRSGITFVEAHAYEAEFKKISGLT